jgi:hypothetical protein
MYCPANRRNKGSLQEKQDVQEQCWDHGPDVPNPARTGVNCYGILRAEIRMGLGRLDPAHHRDRQDLSDLLAVRDQQLPKVS